MNQPRITCTQAGTTWTATITPRAPILDKLLLIVVISTPLAAVVALLGLAGVVSGLGVAFGNHGKGVVAGTAFNQFVAWTFFLAGTLAVIAVPYAFFWNRGVVEEVTVTDTAFVVRHRFRSRGCERSFARQEVSNVRVAVNEGNPSACALCFWDLSMTPMKGAVVAFDCGNRTYYFGLRLTAEEAAAVAAGVQEALKIHAT